jgi:hypothetical protein
MDLCDLLEQQFVVGVPRRCRPVLPFVIAGTGHAE